MNSIKVNDKMEKSIHSGYEGELYFYGDKIIKIFRDRVTNSKNFENKIHKIELLNEKYDGIIKPTDLVYQDDKVVGYAMPYLDGYKSICTLSFKKNEKIKILTELLKKLEMMHKKGIIYGDIHSANILVNKDLDVELCDIDNVKIGKYDIDNLHVNAIRYMSIIKEADETLDTYMYNLYCVSLLFNIVEPYTLEYIRNFPRKLKKYNKEYEDIIDKMICLNKETKDDIKPLIKLP